VDWFLPVFITIVNCTIWLTKIKIETRHLYVWTHFFRPVAHGRKCTCYLNNAY